MLHCISTPLVPEIAIVSDGDDWTLLLPDELAEYAPVIDRLVSGIGTVGAGKGSAEEVA